MAVAFLQLALSMMLVGANVVAGKVLAQSLPVPVILFLRCVLATLIVLPFVPRAALRLPRAGVTLNLFGQAALGAVCYNSFLLAGLRRTGALEGGLVLSSIPAVVAVGAAIILGERLSGRRWLAVALAAGGMMALTLARSGDASGGTLAGDGLLLLAVCSEAAWILLTRVSAARVGILAATLWTQVFGMLLLAPVALPHLAQHLAPLRSGPLAALLVYHAVTASLLCNFLWYAGMRRAPANLGGVFTVLLPATAAALAVLLLGEPVTASLAAGFVLMLGSILLATWPRRRATVAPPLPAAGTVR
jgi:drug/metabolite transporter (DMT)-like permease